MEPRIGRIHILTTAVVLAAGSLLAATLPAANVDRGLSSHTVVLDAGGFGGEAIEWTSSAPGNTEAGWRAGRSNGSIDLPAHADGWVRVTTETGEFLRFRSLGIQPDAQHSLVPLPAVGERSTVDASELVYRAVYPDVEERYRVTGRGLKHDIVLAQVPSWLGTQSNGDMELTWEIQVSKGVSPSVQGEPVVGVVRTDRGVLFETGGGRPPFLLDAARLYEAAPANGHSHPRISWPAQIQFEPLGTSGYLLRLVVPRSWLLDSARRYPVTIDPTVLVYPTALNHTGFATSDLVGTYDRQDGEIATGTLQAAIPWMIESHGFARFDISSIPDCATITGVDLEAWTANHDDQLGFPPRVAVPLPMEVRACAADPVSASNVALYNAVGAGAVYHSRITPPTGSDFCLFAFQLMVYSLNAAARTDLQAALAADFFTIGLTNQIVSSPTFDHLDYIGFNEDINGSCGFESAPGTRIRLRVIYTSCCGDGAVSTGEQCDDGNTAACDGCDATCQLECGNGVTECAETCDDGNSSSCDGCAPTCRLECGNGVRECNETCDDGNTNGCDGCSAVCVIECGNGSQECSETCDDGGTAPCDGCSPTCRRECGDGVRACAEMCDDGNNAPCDGCSATCVIECGNGSVECGEGCDDGGTAPCDGCSPACIVECGDGVRACGEMCDDGNNAPCDGCSSTCVIECGNGTQECGEGCDDGNTAGCDGCSSVCVNECGNGVQSCGEECDDGNVNACDGCSIGCVIECGNGVVECLEMCDDGNTAGGDGCSALCQDEADLEVTWLDVDAHCATDGIHVNWSVAEESDMYGYQVMRGGRGVPTAVSGPVWATGPYSTYEVIDRRPSSKQTEYWIEELCTSGVGCSISPKVETDCRQTPTRRRPRTVR